MNYLKEFVIAAVAYVKVNIFIHAFSVGKIPNETNVENADNGILIKYSVD